MKHLTALALLACLLAACGNPDIDENKELVTNGGFEIVSAGLPAGWETDVYDLRNRKVSFRVDEGNAPEGTRYFVIENFDAADAKLVQRVPVRPNTYYRLSCLVRAAGVSSSELGANISVLGTFSTSESVRDTNGQWKTVELYGKTGDGQMEMSVCCRVGGYGQESRGTAAFDGFSVRAVRSSPLGKAVAVFAPEIQKQSENEPKDETAKNRDEAKKKTNADFWIFFFTLVFITLFVFIYYYFIKKDRFKLGAKPDAAQNSVLVTIIVILAAAFVLRIVMGLIIEGQEGDLACFKGWGNDASRVSWPDYYDYFSGFHKKNPARWCDYPPAYIMILAFLSFIQRTFAFDNNVYTLLIKLPNIISDIVACILIFRIAQRKFNDVGAIGLTALYAFNPAIIINSAIWGQADAIYTLLALLIVIFILDDKIWLAGVVLGIAILIKIQTAFVAFALLFALAEKKSLKTWLLTIGAGLGTFIAITIPFAIKLPPEWIIVQLIGTLTGYPYMSVNAYNFFSIFGTNWRPSHETFMIIPGTGFSLSGDMFSIIVGYLLLAFAAFLFFYSREKSKNYFSGLFIISVIFMFIVGMHERYLYAAVLFSLMTYVYTKDRRFLYLFGGFTISVFTNVYHILDVFIVNSMIKGSVPDYPIDPLRNPFMLVTSLANLALFIYLFKTGVDVYILKKTKISKDIAYGSPLESEEIAAAAALSITENPSPVSTAAALKNKKEKGAVPLSSKRNLVLGLGIAGVFLIIPSLFAWLVGHTEMKKFPHDMKIRAGWALGVGIVVVFAAGIAFAIGMYPGLVGAQILK